MFPPRVSEEGHEVSFHGGNACCNTVLVAETLRKNILMFTYWFHVYVSVRVYRYAGMNV